MTAILAAAPLLAASRQQRIAIAIALVLVIGGLIYLWSSVRRGPKPGSELELAPNRKPYLGDDALEGPKLDRALTWATVLMGVVAIGLPLYWLREPHRQHGSGFDRGAKWFDERAITDGKRLFQITPGDPPTPREAHFGCAMCHGAKGDGGAAPYSIPVNPKDPHSALRQVSWKAPALNTVTLRYRDTELRTIIVYGRQGTPMPAWGVAGGGPMDDQQVDDLIAYLHSISIGSAAAVQQAVQYSLDGHALFDAYCARCHTQGFSYGEPGPEGGGGGTIGPSLIDGVTLRRFPNLATQTEWVTNTADFGKPYGVGGISHGLMPHFSDMLTAQQIAAIVAYERTL